MSRVIVAGSIITDMSVSVAEHPKVGETVMGGNLKYSPGGKGANQAVAAARLSEYSDTKVVMIGCIGKDAFGEQALDFLSDESIETIVNVDYSNPTGIAMIQVSKKSANNSIVVIPGANMCLEPDNVDKVTYRKGDVLVSQFEIPLSTIQRFFHKGRHSKCINILNPAPVISPNNKEVKEILKLTDVLIVNESEIEALSGGYGLNYNFPEDEFLVGHLKEIRKIANIPIIIVTMGQHGAYGYLGEDYVRIKGIDVKAIDTTGAGDCFVGAMATQLANFNIKNIVDLKEAMVFANQAAALSVTKQGSGIAMPTIDELDMLREEINK